MIYLDNAATTMSKPKCVADAVIEAMGALGNEGRGAHEAALNASRVIFEARRRLAQLFHGENPRQIVFTANATESLNIAIKGILKKGDHVITTVLEHNSVLRPLYEMEAKGVELTIIPCDRKGCVCVRDFEGAVRGNTRAIVCTHGSNLTGNLVDLKAVGEIARRRKVLFCVDASQTAGVFPIDVQDMGIDILCFTGHKSLLGPQGTGGMYVREQVAVEPLKTGGSGIFTYERNHPGVMPTALEAGTLNGHGIAGLGAAVSYIQETGMDVIRRRELGLMRRFYDRVKGLPGLKVYGDFDTGERCPIVTVNLKDYDSSWVSDRLFADYGIATRPGAHCAPLLHQALGTVNQGAVRFSFSYSNREDEADRAAEAVKEILEEEESSLA